MTRVLILAAALAAVACSSLPPAKQAKLDLLECRAKALAPVVEPAFDALELALDIYAGRASLSDVLSALEASEADVKALLAALKACDAPAPTEGSAG